MHRMLFNVVDSIISIATRIQAKELAFEKRSKYAPVGTSAAKRPLTEYGGKKKHLAQGSKLRKLTGCSIKSTPEEIHSRKEKGEARQDKKGKGEARRDQKEKEKGRQRLLRSDSTRQPDRAHGRTHARHDTKRFPGWTHRPTSNF